MFHQFLSREADRGLLRLCEFGAIGFGRSFWSKEKQSASSGEVKLFLIGDPPFERTERKVSMPQRKASVNLLSA